MKRKLMSILLALTMCLSLAGSAFAEGEAETPAPGEQTETLTVEPETPREDVEPEEIPPEDVAEPKETAPPEDVTVPEEPQTLADLIAAEGVLSEDGTCVMLGRQYGHLHDDEVRDFAAEASEILKSSETAEGYVALRPSYGHLCFDISCPYNAAVAEKILESTSAAGLPGPGVCPYCGKENWTFWKETEHKTVSMDKNYHTESYYMIYLCDTTECKGYCQIPMYKLPYEPHTWTQTSIEYVNQGNDHEATRRYICNVCKATGHVTEDEAHAMYRTGTVYRHYHRGSLHYIEWNTACICGRTGTELETRPCPGSESGVGCINIPVHFIVRPPDEGDEETPAPEEAPIEDVAEPGETAPPEDVTVPEEAPTEGTT